MADNLIQLVIDSVDEAKTHRLELQELLHGLAQARNQVTESAAESRRAITQHFLALQECVVKALDERQSQLTLEVGNLEQSALEPLAGCEQMIQKDVAQAEEVLAQGKQILSGDVDSPESMKTMSDFKTSVSVIDLHSLPEVPSLQDVACIHIDLPQDGTDIEHQLREAVESYGQVIGRAPVQIIDTEDRAGAILMKWAEVQPDEVDAELSEFCLRYCEGDLRHSPACTQFSEVYQGHAMQTIVRQLTAGKTYSFQVRGRIHEEESWSPWSIPFVTMTTIPQYEWRPGVEGYQLTDNNRTVCKTSDSAGIVVSDGAMFQCGHSIVFRVKQAAEAGQTDVIGLSVSGSLDNLNQKGALYLTTDGHVFVDGQEKTTRLPELKRDSYISFDTEILSSNKVRLTAEIDDKIVTLDWAVEPADGVATGAISMMSQPPNPSLYFFTRLGHTGWEIAVE